MKLKDYVALFCLAALWGASFLFMRIASPIFGPFLTIQGRVTIAAVALLLYMVLTRQSAGFKERWKQYIVIGAVNAAIPFTLIATSALYLPASMSSILNALTPLFTALVAWGWMKEELGIQKWLGLLVGIFGVGILVGWSSIPLTSTTLIAIAFAVLSTVVYGIGGVYTKKAFSGISPLALATGQQIGASILLLPFTLTHLPKTTANFTPTAVFSVIGLALFCTAIAYLIYFYLVEKVGPTRTVTVTYLIPAFGIGWGMLFLHETFTIGMLIGLFIILVSVLLISGIQFKRPIVEKGIEL